MSQPASLPTTLSESVSPPRWIGPWLALLAPLYVISPLALLALPHLGKLPLTARYVLAFYAVSQQLPALFSPEPLTASLSALARTLLMFGLMGVGVALGSSERLKPFAVGLGVVFVTALIYSVVGGLNVLTGRLGHPYMTPITLGLGGAIGVWIALFTRGTLLWRLPLGLTALIVLLLSGSRGPLAAALVGCLAGFAMQRGRRVAVALLALAGLLIGGLYVGDRLGVGAINRLSSADTTGRDIVWYNTLTVVRSQPWSGVGSYRLGKYLTPPGDTCSLFEDARGSAPPCPAWIGRLGNPWLIAHNAALQQLAETGPLGLLGLLTLLCAVVTACVQRRSVLGLAIISGLIVSTLNDNTLLLPSPFFAEMFWVAAGLCLVSLRALPLWFGPLHLAISVFLASPILAGALLPPPHIQMALNMLAAPKQFSGTGNYLVVAQFDVPAGEYRASLAACQRYCVNLVTVPFTVSAASSPVLTFESKLFPASSQRLELRLMPGASPFRAQPYGIRSWTVVNN